mgnify:CR=1 FL=1
MKLTETKLSGVYLIEPDVFQDERGFFYESYNQQKFEQAQLKTVFVQDNHSRSVKQTLRGLHYQRGKFAQTKLVRCTLGEVLDVVVDLRKKSPTFGQGVAYKLSAQNKLQMYIPAGFAHGFCVLSEVAEFQYKCDKYYAPAEERGIIWNDPDLAVDWGIDQPIISRKDQNLPLLKAISPAELFN